MASVVEGGRGAETWYGGGGEDAMGGGSGDDAYVVDNAGDVVTDNARGGADHVLSSISFVLGSNLENLTLTGSSALNGTGNESDNALTGNGAANLLDGGAGADTLDGGAGADTMVGGSGDDAYVVDSASDVVTENANGGTDRVLSSISYVLGNNVENLTLTGSSALNGSGNGADNALPGNGAANLPDGGDGADTPDGGAGPEPLMGMAGQQ